MCEGGLSGGLWPIHCKPYDDEVFSSWLLRLIRAYGAGPPRFCAQVWPQRAVWNRDIDKGTDDKLLEVVAVKTATPRTRVVATTLRGYRGYRTEDLRARKQLPWLLRLGVRSYTRSRAWLQYCPRCLHEDADPYFRRCWRLAFVTVCPAHHRRLLDRCGDCGAVANFHRLPSDADTMAQCDSCRGDVRLAHAPLLGRSPAYHRLVWFQTFLLHTMRTGRCRVGRFNAVPGARFFAVLHTRVRLFLTARHAPAFREAFGTSLPSSFFERPGRSPHQRSLEGLSVEERLEFMFFLAWWFEQRLAGFITRGSEVDFR